MTAQEAADLFAASVHGLKGADTTAATFSRRLAPFVGSSSAVSSVVLEKAD